MTESRDQPLFSTLALRRRFDAAAGSFDTAGFLRRRTMDGLLERLEPMSIEPRVIADIGSATGQGSRALTDRWRRARILSVDLSRQMLKAGQKGRGWFSRLRDVQADAHALPFRDGSIDLLVANLSLPWLSHPETCLREIGRVLRKEGLFAFATLGPDTLAEVRDAWREVDTGPHVHPFADMHDIGDALIRAGMTDPVLDVERIAVTYGGPDALFKELRQAGATNLLATRTPGLTGKERFGRFRDALAGGPESDAADARISVTVELVFGHAWARGSRQTPQEFHVDAASIGRVARKP